MKQLYLAIIKEQGKRRLPWAKPFFIMAIILSWLIFLFIEIRLWSSFASSLVIFLAVIFAGLLGLAIFSLLAVVRVKEFKYVLLALMVADWRCYEFLYIENKIKDSRLVKNVAFVFVTGCYYRHRGFPQEACVLQDYAVALDSRIAGISFSGKQNLSVADASCLIQVFSAALKPNLFGFLEQRHIGILDNKS